MSHAYVPVQWNRNKAVYDIALWIGIVVYLGAFIGLTSSVLSGDQALSPMILLIRAFGSLAFIMLTLILCIGPLARLHDGFLPLLYNRRHFGVSMFVVTLTHAVLVMIWYHSFGQVNPVVSLFTSPGGFSEVSDFPFQRFGAIALLGLLVMAATSHDYWNSTLSAPVWKAIHMSVYGVYAAVVLHIATGAMQVSNTGFTPMLLTLSVALVAGLHLAAAFSSRTRRTQPTSDGWLSVGSWQDIEDDAGIVVQPPGGERVAVFRYNGNRLAAVANVCKHQNGPLGEGRVIDGCITCPWHGFQYRPEDGRSPPPFTDTIATYELRLDGDELWLNPKPLPEGTARPVLTVAGASA